MDHLQQDLVKIFSCPIQPNKYYIVMKIIEYFDERKILIMKAYNCILGLSALPRLGLFSISPQVNLLDLVWLEYSKPHHLVTAYI